MTSLYGLGMTSLYGLVERNQVGKLPVAPGEPVPAKEPELVDSMTEYPYIATGLQSIQGPYVDLRCEVLGARIYLTRPTAWEVAKLYGFVEPDVHAAVLAENEQYRADNRLLLETLDEERSQKVRVVTLDELRAAENDAPEAGIGR